MSVPRWVRSRARGWGWGWGCVCACAALAALLTLRVPRASRLQADFPHHSPARLAHFLADFTNHPKLYTHLSGEWRVEEEWSNVTWWRYAVSYSCGARCAGRVRLLHAAPPAPAAPRAAPHRLLLGDERCTRLPVLPWPQLCEYTETETVIEPRVGGGSRLREETRARCGVWGAGGCAPDAARRRHLRALMDALQADASTADIL